MKIYGMSILNQAAVAKLSVLSAAATSGDGENARISYRPILDWMIASAYLIDFPGCS